MNSPVFVMNYLVFVMNSPVFVMNALVVVMNSKVFVINFCFSDEGPAGFPDCLMRARGRAAAIEWREVRFTQRGHRRFRLQERQEMKSPNPWLRPRRLHKPRDEIRKSWFTPLSDD